jgi:hypothetical protein
MIQYRFSFAEADPYDVKSLGRSNLTQPQSKEEEKKQCV